MEERFDYLMLLPFKETKHHYEHLKQKYISNSAQYTIKISDELKGKVNRVANAPDQKEILSLFTDIKFELLHLIDDSFTRFKKTNEYKRLAEFLANDRRITSAPSYYDINIGYQPHGNKVEYSIDLPLKRVQSPASFIATGMRSEEFIAFDEGQPKMNPDPSIIDGANMMITPMGGGIVMADEDSMVIGTVEMETLGKDDYGEQKYDNDVDHEEFEIIGDDAMDIKISNNDNYGDEFVVEDSDDIILGDMVTKGHIQSDSPNDIVNQHMKYSIDLKDGEFVIEDDDDIIIGEMATRGQSEDIDVDDQIDQYMITPMGADDVVDEHMKPPVDLNDDEFIVGMDETIGNSEDDMETKGNISDRGYLAKQSTYDNAMNYAMIKDWLTNTAQLPEYYETFFINGYETLNDIFAITSKEELHNIGIVAPGHKTKLWADIRRAQEKQKELKIKELLEMKQDDTDIVPNEKNSSLSAKVNCNEVKYCIALERLIHALKIYKLIGNQQDMNALIEYFQSYQDVINDFNHVIQAHNNEQDLSYIKEKWSHDCDKDKCEMTKRYFRNREKDKGIKGIFWRDLMDSVHCYLYHLEDLGYRVKDSNSSDVEEIKDDCVDNSFGKMYKSVKENRIRRGDNNKYNISIATLGETKEDDEDQDNTVSFSIGFIFYYWKPYKTMTEKEESRDNVNDLSGYSPAELYVQNKYASMKKEILDNKIQTLTKDQFDSALEKAITYIKCDRAKSITSSGGIFLDELHYNIPANSPLTLNHLFL